MDITEYTKAKTVEAKQDLRDFMDNTCTKYSITYRDRQEWIRLNTEFIKTIDRERARVSIDNQLKMLSAPTISALKDLVEAICSKNMSISVVSEKAERIVKLYNNLKQGGGDE